MNQAETIVDHQYLSRENAKFYEILNLLLFVIFQNLVTVETDGKTSSKTQTEKPVARSTRPVVKGEMAFQRCTIV